MAGAGVRLFTAGSILTAQQVNEYLMDQTISRFSDSAARDSSFGGLGEPVLSEGRLAYLDSDNKLYVYDGSNWVELALSISGTSAQVIVYDSSGAPTARTLSGDVTINSTGVTTIDSGKVTTVKIADAAVTAEKIDNAAEITILGIKQTSVIEKITISGTAATGTIPVDVSNGTTYYTANSTGNFVVNLRWNSGTTLNTKLAVGEMATTSFLVTNATAYYVTSVQVNGTTSGVTTRWQGATGAPTLGNANSTDMYTFTVIKTAANTFTVFAAQTKFS